MLLSELHISHSCVCLCSLRQIPSFCVVLLGWNLAQGGWPASGCFEGGRYLREELASP